MVKKIISVVLFCSILVLMSGCGNDREKVEKIGMEFADAMVNVMNTQNKDSAKRMFELGHKEVPNSANLAEFAHSLFMMKNYTAEIKGAPNDILVKVDKVAETKINKENNNAKVTVDVKLTSKGARTEWTHTIDVYLKSENGNWVVYNFETDMHK